MYLDSYIDAGVFASVALVNGLVPGFSRGEEAQIADAGAAIREALAIDQPSVDRLKPSDFSGFQLLARDLHGVFVSLDTQDVDRAARTINALLAQSPASPHLAKEDGLWRLHHHPVDAGVLPMWRAICAESLARLIGVQAAQRLGVCSASRCDRVFVDTSKNATRRFCSASCQNRTKTAAFRARKAGQPD